MIKRIGHVGIVVRDLEEMLKQFETVFGLKPRSIKDAMNGKIRVAFLPVGDGEIELLQPLGLGASLDRFLRTHGQGIHHICLSTDDIEIEMDRMQKQGVAFDDKARIGAHGVRIAFTKPETTGGVAVELSEEDWPSCLPPPFVA